MKNTRVLSNITSVLSVLVNGTWHGSFLYTVVNIHAFYITSVLCPELQTGFKCSPHWGDDNAACSSYYNIKWQNDYDYNNPTSGIRVTGNRTWRVRCAITGGATALPVLGAKDTAIDMWLRLWLQAITPHNFCEGLFALGHLLKLKKIIKKIKKIIKAVILC